MSQNFIPLETALREERTRNLLLQRLRAGEIGAFAAQSYGAELVEWFAAETFEEVVETVFKTNVERRVALRLLTEQAASTKYIWAGPLFYLAVCEQATEVVAFRGQSREPEGHCTVPKTIWNFAFVDETRWVVVYDDFSQLWRKEYMHVHIDDVAFRKIIRDCVDQNSNPIGRPQLFRQDVANFAADLLTGNEKYKLDSFIRVIMEKFGREIGTKNTIDEHYGDIWRLANGRPPRKSNPKIPNK